MLAADRLNCSVFDMEDEPLVWRQRALLARNAEIKAENKRLAAAEREARQRAAGAGRR